MPDTTVSASFFVGVIAVQVAVAAAIVALVRWLLPVYRRWQRQLDAWEGYEDPGTGERRPSIVQRLTHAERTSKQTSDAIEKINRDIGEMKQASKQTSADIQKMAKGLAGVEESAATAASTVVAVGAESRERHDKLSEQVTEIDRKVDEVTARTCGTCNLSEQVTGVAAAAAVLAADTHALMAEQTQIRKAVEDLRSHQAKDGHGVVDLRGSEPQNSATGGDDDQAG